MLVSPGAKVSILKFLTSSPDTSSSIEISDAALGVNKNFGYAVPVL